MRIYLPDPLAVGRKMDNQTKAREDCQKCYYQGLIFLHLPWIQYGKKACINVVCEFFHDTLSVFWFEFENCPDPKSIKIQEKISSFDVLFLLIISSEIAVNNVMEEMHAKVTEMANNLIERKNKIWCSPTNAPVKISLKMRYVLPWK